MGEWGGGGGGNWKWGGGGEGCKYKPGGPVLAALLARMRFVRPWGQHRPLNGFLPVDVKHRGRGWGRIRQPASWLRQWVVALRVVPRQRVAVYDVDVGVRHGPGGGHALRPGQRRGQTDRHHRHGVSSRRHRRRHRAVLARGRGRRLTGPHHHTQFTGQGFLMATAGRQGGWLRAWLFGLLRNAGRRVVVSCATQLCKEWDTLQGSVRPTTTQVYNTGTTCCQTNNHTDLQHRNHTLSDQQSHRSTTQEPHSVPLSDQQSHRSTTQEPHCQTNNHTVLQYRHHTLSNQQSHSSTIQEPHHAPRCQTNKKHHIHIGYVSILGSQLSPALCSEAQSKLSHTL